jgi:hypothetical protein
MTHFRHERHEHVLGFAVLCAIIITLLVANKFLQHNCELSTDVAFLGLSVIIVSNERT